MSRAAIVVGLIFLLAGAAAGLAQQQQPKGTNVTLPVKEITVFKDGHAFVLHEGSLPVDSAGNVPIDSLPTPVLGTFWPYSADKGVRLTSVTAGQQVVAVEKTALNLRELLEANVGADVLISENWKAGVVYPATIVGVPLRSSAELEATSPPNSGKKLPVKGDVILLKTAEGIKPVPLDRIMEVTFKGEQKSRLANEEFRNRLVLGLDWGKRPPAKSASVGYLYVQKGIRWFPSYKLVLDGNGNAQVKLQATLLNELTDLDDVTANLVVGVPSFAFKELTDPMTLQQTATQLSPYFQSGARTASALSNAMMSQAGSFQTTPPVADSAAPPPVNLGPEIAGSQRSEDLFVFTVKHVSLKKGERMVVSVGEFPVKYQDVYTLDVPVLPPPDATPSGGSRQPSELARLLAAPKVTHKIRLQNKSTNPFTTAPALILLGDRLLAQGMMTYTPIGSACDLDITTAVDVKVEKSEKETARVPNAVRWQGIDYARVNLDGTLKLTNYRGQPIALEVTRRVLGNVTAADNQGLIEKSNVFEDSELRDGQYPYWWAWYNWPPGWRHLNSVGVIKWKLTLEAGKSVDLGYSWHYFWR